MPQRIIMIHGRSTKPAESDHKELWTTALLKGVERWSSVHANGIKNKIDNGTLGLDVVYYGDICNQILSESSSKHRRALDAQDPSHGKCLPSDSIRASLDDLVAIERFDKSAFRKVVRGRILTRIQDELASFFSALSGLATLGSANKIVISEAMADLGEYFNEHETGSRIRARLHEKLNPAIRNGEDVMLISHSMGCIVSYDALWKLTRRSEYAAIRAGNGNISQWITIGCPLGEGGVQRNLIDAGQRGSGKYPKIVNTDWLNISAQGDLVAHEKHMDTAENFTPMVTKGRVKSIEDLRIYNCWSENGKANPHKAYGYLAHAVLGQRIAAWVK